MANIRPLKNLKTGETFYPITSTKAVFNEGNTENKVEFWLAKVNPDGSFTEIPGSRITDTIEAKRVVPKVFFSPSFSFVANRGDSFRVFMKSDKDDGFYLQSGTDGIPLFSMGMEVSEVEEVTKLNDISGIVFTKDGKPVVDSENYSIEIDVDNGAIKVVSKK